MWSSGHDRDRATHGDAVAPGRYEGGVIRYDQRDRGFAVGLAALAGYVDATGFLATGGFFLSFMSGNSTRMSVGLATSSPQAMLAAGLIVAFVAGVTAGSLLGRFAGLHRRAVVLAAMALTLAVAAMLGQSGPLWAAALVTTFAMGAENTVFEVEGEVALGLTYMTGTLVRLGQRIAAACTGGPRWDWLPHLYLWTGLVIGASAGAIGYRWVGIGGLWIASAGASGMCLWLALAGDRNVVEVATDG